jgi:hypothetical protein
LRVAGGDGRGRGRDRRSFAISGNGEPDLQLPPSFSSENPTRWQQANYKSQSPHFLTPNARSTVRFCNSGVLGWDGSAFHSTCCRGLAKEQQIRGRPRLRVDVCRGRLMARRRGTGERSTQRVYKAFRGVAAGPCFREFASNQSKIQSHRPILGAARKGQPCQRPIWEDHMRVSPALVAILLIGMTIAAIAPFDVAFAAANVRVAGCARGPNSRARFDWRLLCRPCWIAPRRSRNALAGAGRVGSGHCCGCLRRGHRWTAFQKHLAGCLRRSF